MAISAKVNAVFNIDKKIYTASIDIPNSTPTAALPFRFGVTSMAEGADPKTAQTLLRVTVGTTDQVFVGVAPPMDVISGAINSDIIKELNVQVSEGPYNSATDNFVPPA